MPAERQSQSFLGTRSPGASAWSARARWAWPWAWAGLLGVTAAVHLGGVFFARDLRTQLGFWLVAGLCWLLALFLLGRATPLALGTRPERRAILWLWVVALGLRVPLLALPVAHSDDVYRYLWDGAVQQAGLDPYAGPPYAAGYAAVGATHGELRARINHRELPTIYPPAAQLLFRVDAGLSKRPFELAAAVWRWKLLVVTADLLVLALLLLLLRGQGRDRRWAAVWGAAPLPAVELAWNGHLESLGVLPLVCALWLWQRLDLPRPLAGTSPSPSLSRKRERGRLAIWLRTARPVFIGALTALAVLVKPVAGAVLPAVLRLPRRVLLGFCGGALLLTALTVLPYGRAGAVPPSLGEYGRRWRSNDGAYAVLQAATEAGVRALYQPPYHEPWQSPRLARVITGRDRDTVWPDELAAAVARGLVLLALLALAVVAVRRRWTPVQAALSLLLAYELLTPALHPWYELWPLALAGLWPRLLPPVVVLAALAPLAYLPLPASLAGGGFHHAWWPRAVEHGLGWAALVTALYQSGKEAAKEPIDAPS